MAEPKLPPLPTTAHPDAGEEPFAASDRFDVEHGFENGPCPWHQVKLTFGPHSRHSWPGQTESASLPECDGAQACSVRGTQ